MTNENGSNEEVETLNLKIVKQIEYYFGDYNLGRDKFLQAAIKEDDGWVKLSSLVTFNRLKNLSTDFKVIVDALKTSESNLLEINEDEAKIRRSPSKPLPENNEVRLEELKKRSIYAKGFPLDTTLDQIMDFFKSHGKVENIQMRRKLDKTFRGSIFVVFEQKEDAEKFVNTEDLKFKEQVILREMRENYNKRKAEQKQKYKEEHAKKKLEQQANKKLKKPTDQSDKPLDFEKGCILHITGMAQDTSREDIKEVFESHGKVAWIDFVRGDADAWVRFAEGKAQFIVDKCMSSNNDKLEIKGAEVNGNVLEGEDEVQYWIKTTKAREEKKMKNKKGSFRGRSKRGRGRGGRQNYYDIKNAKKKFKDEDDDDEKEDDGHGDEDGDGDTSTENKHSIKLEDADEPPAKQIKLEEVKSEEPIKSEDNE